MPSSEPQPYVPSWQREKAKGPPRRVFGLGTGLGGGFTGVSVAVSAYGAASGIVPALLLPTVEARIFLPNGNSVDLSMPLVNAIITSALLGGFTLALDTFYNLNVGSEGVRFLFGPGVGLAVLSARGMSVVDLKFPLVLGVEILTEGRGFGFSLQARPLLDIGFLTSPYGYSAVSVGGGLIGVLGFTWYGTQD